MVEIDWTGTMGDGPPPPRPAVVTCEPPFPPAPGLGLLCPSNGLRPEDWRWQLGWRQALLGRRDASLPWDDGVADAYHLAREYARGPDRHHPVPAAAAAAFAVRAGPDSLPRWELEARLLTAQPFDAVAARCGLGAPVVEAYHALFFDVRDRLGGIHVRHAVLGDWLLRGVCESDSGLVLRLAGHLFGPAAVDLVAAQLRSPRPLPAGLDRLAVGELLDLVPVIEARVVVLMVILGPDPGPARELAALTDLLRALRQAAPALPPRSGAGAGV